jgi:O-6-methylguanine DNA methyltransferase
MAGRIYRALIRTCEGDFVARYSGRGLCGLGFPSGTRAGRGEGGKGSLPAQIGRWHVVASKALRLALAGQPPKRLPPLDLAEGTEFQQRVWRVLRRIGWGQTQSYAQVAQAVGNPRAVRAVGGACGANPIPVLVPCHRVLAASGGLGGFSGGLNWKRALLRREGLRPLVGRKPRKTTLP